MNANEPGVMIRGVNAAEAISEDRRAEVIAKKLNLTPISHKEWMEEQKRAGTFGLASFQSYRENFNPLDEIEIPSGSAVQQLFGREGMIHEARAREYKSNQPIRGKLNEMGAAGVGMADVIVEVETTEEEKQQNAALYGLNLGVPNDSRVWLRVPCDKVKHLEEEAGRAT